MVEINLLPWRKYVREQTKRQQRYVITFSLCIGLLAVIIWHCYITYLIAEEKKIIRLLENRSAQHADEVKLIRNHGDQNKTIQLALQFLQQAESLSCARLRFFYKFHLHFFADINLLDIESHQQSTTLTGYTYSVTSLFNWLKIFNDKSLHQFAKLVELQNKSDLNLYKFKILIISELHHPLMVEREQ